MDESSDTVVSAVSHSEPVLMRRKATPPRPPPPTFCLSAESRDMSLRVTSDDGVACSLNMSAATQGSRMVTAEEVPPSQPSPLTTPPTKSQL